MKCDPCGNKWPGAHIDREIIVFDNRVLTSEFEMRYAADDWKFEIHHKGNGCMCYGKCDGECSLIVTYPSLSQEWKRDCALVKVQWDDTLWKLKPGYYRLIIKADGCDCEVRDIKIGKRCGFVMVKNTARQPDSCDATSGQVMRKQTPNCKQCPPPKKEPLGCCEKFPDDEKPRRRDQRKC